MVRSAGFCSLAVVRQPQELVEHRPPVCERELRAGYDQVEHLASPFDQNI